MGAFSIVHWLMVILAFAPPITAIALAKPDRHVGKKSLLVWTAIAAAPLVVVGLCIVLSKARADVVTVLGLAFLCYFIVRAFLAFRLAARLQMFGWSKWWALFGLITGSDVLLGIVLGAMSTQDEKSAA